MIELRKVEFPGETGAMLAARRDLPAQPRAFALFAHCFTYGVDIFAASRIVEGLAARGIAVLRSDFTCIGGSKGELANTNFSSNVGDLPAAAAPDVRDAAAVVTIGAPASAAHVTHNFAANLEDIVEKGTAEVTLAGRTFTITRQFLDDLTGRNFLDNRGRMGNALLVCHERRDEYVGIDNASMIFTVARHPRSFLSLDTADHPLRRRADGIYVADVIAVWGFAVFACQRTDGRLYRRDHPRHHHRGRRARRPTSAPDGNRRKMSGPSDADTRDQDTFEPAVLIVAVTSAQYLRQLWPGWSHASAAAIPRRSPDLR